MKPFCEYAKSDMTPCVRRDGAICYAMDSNDNPICVGCEKPPSITGIAPPSDWAQQVTIRRDAERRARNRIR